MARMIERTSDMQHIAGPVVPRKEGHVPYARSVTIARLLLERMDGCTVWKGSRDFEPEYVEPATTPWEWIVGGKYQTLKFSFGEPTSETVDTIARWIDSHPSDGCSFYGSWIEEGVVYVDACDVTITQAMAEWYGRERNEIAIYNIKTGDTVRLK